ncbi:hypothetical protein CAEBREN_02823 [Caenorhabditis brenneri]|uniref:Sdz-33 F-box domain-containing protein n=1 Tax=Caenorhabditis brenneri TaxID=135651 RepID=G0MRK7_CAEBE|nr:hypothetical protein CAEBREN_02823 [Caenorhabditis brenneri]
MKDVVKLMTVIEIYKLSLATKRSKAIVKSMKLKTDGFAVSLCQRLTHINILSIEMNNKSTTQAFYDRTDEDILRSQAKVKETKHIVSDPINECLEMAKGLITLFVSKSRKFSLHINYKEPEELKQILSEILTQPYTEILFFGDYMGRHGGYNTDSVIDGGVLNYLMNNVKLDTNLSIQAKLPEDFNHENAFKFRKICYWNCSWVTLETLKSFRNFGSISLYDVNLDSKTINKFLTHWVNSDKDMMEDIKLRIIPGNRFIKNEVLNNLITTVIVEDQPTYFLKARKTENRKRILGKLTIWENTSSVGINLETVEASEEYRVQLEILELKEKEKDLEDQLKGLEDSKEKIQNESSNKEEALKELMRRKDALQLELVEVRRKLLALKA